MTKQKRQKCYDCGKMKTRGIMDVIHQTEDYQDGEDVFICSACNSGQTQLREEANFRKKKIPCGRKGCKNIASRLIDWYSLTGEYTKDNKQVALCINCDDGRLCQQEINRQIREMNGDLEE